MSKVRYTGVFMAAYLLFVLVPIYWLLIMSLKSNGEILGSFTLFPQNLTFDNYAAILNDPSWYMGYVNSFIYVSLNTLISLFVALPAAYAFSRYRFPVVWAVFFPLTYLCYTHPEYHEYSWVLWVEYIVLFTYLFFEIQFQAGPKTHEDWVREKPFLKAYLRKSIPARMNIKLDRIAAHLEPGDRVLDIGTGNGGLCRELRG